MLVDFGLLQNSALLVGENSGSRNSSPDDFAFFLSTEYFCPLYATTSPGILIKL